MNSLTRFLHRRYKRLRLNNYAAQNQNQNNQQANQNQQDQTNPSIQQQQHEQTNPQQAVQPQQQENQEDNTIEIDQLFQLPNNNNNNNNGNNLSWEGILQRPVTKVDIQDFTPMPSQRKGDTSDEAQTFSVSQNSHSEN